MSSEASLATVLRTTVALVIRLSESLDHVDTSASAAESNSNSESHTPLPLLSAAAKSLKAQITKLSLLAITPPFTPSAVVNVLPAVNSSVLPALVTAMLLITAERFTGPFHREAAVLTKATLKDLEGFVRLVERKNGREFENVEVVLAEEKKSVMEATGRLWDRCDALVELAEEGIAGFIAKQAGQFLALVKDAVRELEEWQPGGDDDFGDLAESDEEDGEDIANGRTNDENYDELNKYKEEALVVLRRIPMSLHVAIKNRLQKGLPVDLGDQNICKLEGILEQYKVISDAVDEAAGSLYEEDVEQSQRRVQRAKNVTVNVLETLLHPWGATGDEERVSGAENGQTKEDRYMQRALDWIKTAGTDSEGPLAGNSPARVRPG